MRQEATIHIRLDKELRDDLETIQKSKEHKKLSETVREALDEYVIEYYKEKPTKILRDNF